MALAACGSDDEQPPITIATIPPEYDAEGRYAPFVQSYCDPVVDGIRIYVTNMVWAGSAGAGGDVAVIRDPNCKAMVAPSTSG